MKFDQSVGMPTDVSIITTYRCQMRCKMCNIWKNPTDPKKEIKPKDLEILPPLKFVNITGGEPFVRHDLSEIVDVLYKKSNRIVISTSGWHYKRIISLAEKYPRIGIRVSIEGLEKTNDELRGRNGGFQRGVKTLRTLKKMGIKDIGFGITVSNHNSRDMLDLYDLAQEMGMEFATAAFHNSFYFHKDNNEITNKNEVKGNFAKLINCLLSERHPKSWFRAFFNLGLINYIDGGRRMLPCEAGTANFFIDPYGDVLPCNGMENRYWKERMGNIREGKSFKEIWFSLQAQKVRKLVSECPKNCWMVGTAAPVMKKYIRYPSMWVAKNKLKKIIGSEICTSHIPYYNVGQSLLQGDLRSIEQNFVSQDKKSEYTLNETELDDMLHD